MRSPLYQFQKLRRKDKSSLLFLSRR